MIRPQGTFEPSSDWSLNNVAACVSCDRMWSPNCFSDSAYSTIDKLASFYDTTLLAPTYLNHFGCNLGPKHLPSTLLVSFVPLVSQAGAACTVYSCWEIYDMPTSVCRSGKPPNSKAHCAPCPYPPEIQWRWAGCCLFRPSCMLGTSRLGYWCDISPKCPDLLCKSNRFRA